jgi:hypothetical protein
MALMPSIRVRSTPVIRFSSDCASQAGALPRGAGAVVRRFPSRLALRFRHRWRSRLDRPRAGRQLGHVVLYPLVALADLTLREVVAVHRLLQLEHQVVAPRPLQAARDLLPAGSDVTVPEVGQLIDIPLSSDDRAKDRHPVTPLMSLIAFASWSSSWSVPSAYAGWSCWLRPRVRRAPATASEWAASAAAAGTNRPAIQGVQFHQPLAFLHVRFASRQVLGALRVRQHHPDPMLFQQVEKDDPINPCGLHRHRIDAALNQPLAGFDQVRRPRPEFPHRALVPVVGNGDEMTFVADVDTGRSG